MKQLKKLGRYLLLYPIIKIIIYHYPVRYSHELIYSQWEYRPTNISEA